MGGGDWTQEPYIPNQKEFDKYVDIAQQQMMQQPSQIQQSYTEQPVSETLVQLIEDKVPDWFLWSSFIVGAVTLGLILVRISPAWVAVKKLLEIWANLLKLK